MTEKHPEHTDGEYRIVRPAQENRFADAEYIPQSEAPELRSLRFAPPPAEAKPEKPRRGISAGTVVALCLICGVLGGAVGAFGVGWYTTHIREAEAERAFSESIAAPEPVAADSAAAAADGLCEERALGIVGETVSQSVARYYDMVQGVYVWSVASGSAAEAAGLCSGDVITALGDTPVQSVEALQNALRACASGSVSLSLSRGGEQLEAEIALG